MRGWGVISWTYTAGRALTLVRFLRVHPLRAAGSLQLAAAFLAAERRPVSLEIVTLDARLGAAARKEGFMRADVLPEE
jgi:hypothetical protein